MLHQPAELYWELTPREVEACTEAHMQFEELQNIRAGTIAAAVMNTMRSKKRDKVLTWKDVFRPFASQARKQWMSHAEMLALVKGQYEAMEAARGNPR